MISLLIAVSLGGTSETYANFYRELSCPYYACREAATIQLINGEHSYIQIRYLWALANYSGDAEVRMRATIIFQESTKLKYHKSYGFPYYGDVRYYLPEFLKEPFSKYSRKHSIDFDKDRLEDKVYELIWAGVPHQFFQLMIDRIGDD